MVESKPVRRKKIGDRVEERLREATEHIGDYKYAVEPLELQRLRDQRRKIVSRLSEHVAPERVEEFEVREPSDKFSKQYDVADDELVVTLIGQKTEMRLVLNWQQARELAAELTAAEDAANAAFAENGSSETVQADGSDALSHYSWESVKKNSRF